MLYRNESAAITQQWQRQLEESLEGGEALWLELGVSNRLVDNVQALTALHDLAARRADVMTPGLFVGGDGVVWTATCMNPAVGAGTTPAPSMTLLYGGADRATYMATLATLPGAATHTRQSLLTGLPAGLRAWLWPISQPGVAPQWSALPFVMTTPSLPISAHDASASSDAWLPWLALVVVMGLIITALFV